MEIILKRLLSVALLAVVLSTGAVAGNSKSDDPDQRVEKLTKKLDLTSEQQEKAIAILLDAKTQNEALAKKYKLEAYQAERKDLRVASQKEMSDMLTPEQREKLESMEKQKKKKQKKQKQKKQKE
jgi:Spy/CpxP family protein refolding chaperone